jgi:hypothetical protein
VVVVVVAMTLLHLLAVARFHAVLDYLAAAVAEHQTFQMVARQH